MRTQRLLLGFVAVSGLACLWQVLSDSRVTAQAKQRAVLTVDEIQSGTVIGRLGIELGHVCTIEGTIVAETSKAKSNEGKQLLRIHAIDGKPLVKPVSFASDWTGHERFRKLKLRPDELMGRTVKWAVYETGEFSGLPTGDIYNPRLAWHGFGFSSRLVVVHDFADEPAQRAVKVSSPFRSAE